MPRPARPWRRYVGALATLVAVAACGGGGGSSGGGGPSTSPSVTPTTTTTPATTGPPTAHLALVGTGGAAGHITAPQIQCNEPSLTGPQIRVFATAPGKGTSVMVAIHAGTVTVRYDSGAGTTYRERDFSGTGLTGFDAAHGVAVSSPLTETTVAGGKTGSLGAITSISGSISCGNQTQGASQIVLTGATSAGHFSQAQSPVSVECGATGALLLGIIHAGSTPILVDFGLNQTGISVLLITANATPVDYQKTGAGLITKSGGTVTVPKTATTGPNGDVITVSGTATCGT